MGQIEQSLFDWIDPKWIGGQWAYTNWASRESVQVNEINQTIDFPKLQKAVASPSAVSLKTSLQNQVRPLVETISFVFVHFFVFSVFF